MRRKATRSTSRRRTITTWLIRRRGRLSSVLFSSRYLSSMLRTCRSCYHWCFLSAWRPLADSPANQLSIDGRIFSIGIIWGLSWKEPGGVLVLISHGCYCQDERSVVYRAKDEPISFFVEYLRYSEIKVISIWRICSISTDCNKSITQSRF